MPKYRVTFTESTVHEYVIEAPDAETLSTEWHERGSVFHEIVENGVEVDSGPTELLGIERVIRR